MKGEAWLQEVNRRLSLAQATPPTMVDARQAVDNAARAGARSAALSRSPASVSVRVTPRSAVIDVRGPGAARARPGIAREMRRARTEVLKALRAAANARLRGR